MINSKKKGFTIVELVIVVAVIAILAAVLIPTFSNLVKKANESADIQAVRNMNVYLAQAEATEGVNSILDVYEIFEESDYVVENYKPLYKGRYFFYDKQKNQILYVDEGNQVLFPTDSKGEGQGTNDWFSLSLEIEAIAPELNDGVYVVTKAEEYVWVAEQLNKGITNDITISISGTVDFKGANITVSTIPSGKNLTIKGSNNAIIKNVTSINPDLISKNNSDNSSRYYGTAALFANVAGNLTIQDVTFENINVKNTHAGSVALIASYVTGNVTLNNVAINNSNVIGHRAVGALFGDVAVGDNGSATINFGNTISLTNVKVQTVGGKSGKYIGQIQTNRNNSTSSREDSLTAIKTELNKIAANNVTFSIYECEQNNYGKGLVNGIISSWINDSNGNKEEKTDVHSNNSYFIWVYYVINDGVNSKQMNKQPVESLQ